MTKRKGLSQSLRWQVFARDGFACRYCGRSAGEGTELHADHLVSVADGGTNEMDNLVTACQCCNGGKGARSLQEAPTPLEVVDRINATAASLEAQSQAIQRANEARKRVRQDVINVLCEVYDVESVKIDDRSISFLVNVQKEHGADRLVEWIEIACDKRVREWDVAKYVGGIIRTRRERGEL